MRLIGAEVFASQHAGRVNSPALTRMRIWVVVPDGLSVKDGVLEIDEETGFHYFEGDPVYELDYRFGEASVFLRPLTLEGAPINALVGPCVSGCFAVSSDSRFPSLNAIRLHDRYDTPEDYAALSR